MFLLKSRYEEMKEQYEEFDKEHPEVWEYFVRFTFDRINRGFDQYSVNGIFERIRWETARPGIYGTANNTFKLNNNHRPFYARRFTLEYPQFEEFFKTRKQISRYRSAAGLPPLGPNDFDSVNPERKTNP